MSDVPEGRSIEVDDDPGLSRRASHLQVVGRWLLVLVVAGAITGVAGHGPLSWSTARTSDARVEVDYERFGRRGGSQGLQVRVAGELAADGRWTLVLSGALAERHELDTITPEPATMQTSNSGIELSFEQRGAADLSVHIALSPGGMWREESRIAVPAGGEVTIRQIIYP